MALVRMLRLLLAYC